MAWLPRTIKILHLSDIQFVSSGNVQLKVGELLSPLLRDLRRLPRRWRRPHLVAITGDLAEHANPAEYRLVLQFCQDLASALELPPSRILLIPGNHDVDWGECKIAEARDELPAASAQLDGAPLAPPKWNNFGALLPALQGASTFNPGTTPWALQEFNELGVVVACLNSTVLETHRDGEHFGYVGPVQWQWFEQAIRPHAGRRNRWLRLALVHHNVMSTPNQADSLRDVEDLRWKLGPKLDLVLHGHIHKSAFGWLKRDVPVLATGSLNVGDAGLPTGTLHKYQMIRIDRPRSGWFLRPRKLAWAGRHFTPNQGWAGDNFVSRNPNQWTDEVVLSEYPRLLPVLAGVLALFIVLVGLLIAPPWAPERRVLLVGGGTVYEYLVGVKFIPYEGGESTNPENCNYQHRPQLFSRDGFEVSIAEQGSVGGLRFLIDAQMRASQDRYSTVPFAMVTGQEAFKRVRASDHHLPPELFLYRLELAETELQVLYADKEGKSAGDLWGNLRVGSDRSPRVRSHIGTCCETAVGSPSSAVPAGSGSSAVPAGSGSSAVPAASKTSSDPGSKRACETYLPGKTSGTLGVIEACMSMNTIGAPCRESFEYVDVRERWPTVKSWVAFGSKTLFARTLECSRKGFMPTNYVVRSEALVCDNGDVAKENLFLYGVATRCEGQRCFVGSTACRFLQVLDRQIREVGPPSECLSRFVSGGCMVGKPRVERQRPGEEATIALFDACDGGAP